MLFTTRATALLTASWALLAPTLAGPVPVLKRDEPRAAVDSRTTPVLSNITHFGPDAPARRMFTRDEMIAGIRRSLPAERVVSSADLPKFLADNVGKLSYTILVEDTGEVIDMSTVEAVAAPNTTSDSSTLKGRIVSPPPQYCNKYTTWTSSDVRSAWTAWFPASSCEYTGLDPSGGSTSVSWSFGLAYSETFTVGFTVLDTINYGFSFGITESYTQSATFGCNIPGQSVGQVWFQGFAGYAHVAGSNCVLCTEDGGPRCSNGQSGDVGFPQPGNYHLGCSVGTPNVACNAKTSWTVDEGSP